MFRRDEFVIMLVTALAACAAIGTLVWWFGFGPLVAVPKRTAVEREPAGAAGEAPSPEALEGSFLAFGGKASTTHTNAWPRFRGAAFDSICRDGVPLAMEWPADGPPVLWSIELGEGYAGAAVADGRVYVLDYDSDEEGDVLRCFSFEDGAEIWRRWYRGKVKRNHGMSRTVPAVANGCVVTIGPKCRVMCCDAGTGGFRWAIDLPSTYGTEVPLWYTGQCPLIDGDVAVIATGGDALLIGVDCATGEVVWETPNPRGWKMSHSSIMPMTVADRQMYVYCAIGGMVGVAAGGDNPGAVLWETDAWAHSVVSPSPVVFPDGRIFVTAGYGVGSRMFQVAPAGDGFAVTSLFTLDRKVFACEQHTPILFEGRLYSVMPNDAGALQRQCVCIDPSGNMIWNSGPERRFGLGPFLVADDKLFVLDDEGVLTMARIDHNRYVELGRHRVLDGHDAWGPMAIADGRLVLRDLTRMVCLDLSEKEGIEE